MMEPRLARAGIAAISLTVALLALMAASCFSQDADERVGFRDDFSSADGWKDGVWPGCTGMASITSDGEQATFTTLNGSFMVGASAAWAPDWPDWDKNVAAGLAMIVKKYPVKVDLDRYHYLVARMTHSGTYMALAVNGWDTKVCFRPGLHAVDLRDIPQGSLRGVQPVDVRLTFLNTEGKVALDEVRLVDELTPEERAGFIPGGLDLRLDRLEPRPYHGLEALNARSGAPIRFDFPAERVVFHDTSTGAEVWRMTRSIRTESCDSFSPDGSAIPIYNRSFRGMTLYDFDAGELRELADLRGAPTFSRVTPSIFYLLQSADQGDKAHYTIQAVNFRTGEARVVADWLSEDSGGGEFGLSGTSELLILGLKEGRAIYLIDPRKEDPTQRVRRIPLPMRMKGSSLSHDDQRVNWQRCYYFQSWQMDLATGAIQLGGYPTYGGHEIFGRETKVGRYGSMMLSHRHGILPLDEATAGEVRIWSNWLTPVPSDYGQLAADDRWLVTNGTDAEVANKRLLIDGNESGTVLQVVHDFTSRNSWDSNTYSRVSPDTTKLAYMSDMLGDTDVYIAVTRRPQAPRNVTLSREGNAVRLGWEPPLAGREVRGYNIYRSSESGKAYRRINRELVTTREYLDEPSGMACYAVVAEEHSGLEGLYSEEVSIGVPEVLRICAEIEEGALTPPMRQHFDGACSNFRCARVWKETPEEAIGRSQIEVTVASPATYAVWLRAKGKGTTTVQAAGEDAAFAVDTQEWSWVRGHSALGLDRGRQTLTLTSASDGLCLDRLLLTTDLAETPSADDERDPTPAAVQDLRVTEVTTNQVRLAWTPSADLDLDHYSVYVGEMENFTPGNDTVLASGKATEALDYGFKPGSTLYYKVVATNKRGVASAPATVRVETPGIEVATLQLDIAEAELTGGLERGEAKGLACVLVPAPLPKDASRPKATWHFAAPREGTYYVWARYTTYDAKQVSMLWFETDGEQKVNGTNWRLRFPCTLTRHLDGVKPGEETWFADKMLSGYWAGPTDALTLTAGPHTLSVGFDPTHAPNGPRLLAVFLSNDPSYRPPGFDPRVDFVK